MSSLYCFIRLDSFRRAAAIGFDGGACEWYHIRRDDAGTKVTSGIRVIPDLVPKSAALDSLPLFAGLTAETRRRLTTAAIERTYAAGETLFRAGTRPAGVYIVVAGHVRITRSRDGRRYVVHTEGPGGTLAEVPFFEEGMLPATATAIDATRCLILNRDTLRSIMREDPDVAWLFLRRLSVRIREVVDRLDRASTQGVPNRLASFLLSRAESTHDQPFTLGMTQLELAEELGTVREVVVRGLAQLRTLGVIGSAGRGRYVIRDVAVLRRWAGS